MDHQGTQKRVLCVCTMGLLRSPTAAWVLSNDPFNWNTRSAGVDGEALVPLSLALVDWADEFVCMEQEHRHKLEKFLHRAAKKFYDVRIPMKKVHTFNIPDEYEFRQPELVELMKEKFLVRFGFKEAQPIVPFSDIKMPHERG